MSEHVLTGCRPEPLGSYLKALGVLRLVAEQVDPAATACWRGDDFALQTTLSREELLRFFLDRYVPTPVVSPWNSSSGFGREGVGELSLLEDSVDDRLEPYRRAIAVARDLLASREAHGWDKATMIVQCRNELPDEAVPWLDAAVVLTGDGRDVAYPPLLGTGGNDGRLEFSRNFHRRLVDVLGLADRRRRGPVLRTDWLREALFGSGGAPALRGESPGQFDPGAAGGANSAPTGNGEALVNPWDFVLLIEGTTLFASGVSRRMSAGATGRAAMPFMVSATPVGFASASDERGRGELWAPLWTGRAGIAEIRRLFTEGRAEWLVRRAASGLDLAKAAASLGVDRGVDSFVRHAFVERFGLSTVAVAAGRTRVESRREIAPLGQLDAWVDRVRRSDSPSSVGGALRRLDWAAFDLAHEGGAARLLAVLTAAAGLELAVARSGAFRARSRVDPIWGLRAADWVPALLKDGSSPELRLALALSSGRDVDGRGRTAASLRWLLRPVAMHEGRLRFTDRVLVQGLGSRPLSDVLAAAHARRALERGAQVRGDEGFGLPTRYARCRDAPLADVVAWARGEIDEQALADTMSGLLLLDWSVPWSERLHVDGPRSSSEPAVSVLGPFFARPASDGPSLAPEPSWPAELMHGRTANVLEAALRRLRIARLQPAPLDAGTVAAAGPPGARLAAVLFCPLSSRAASDLLAEVASPMPANVTDTKEEPRAQP